MDLYFYQKLKSLLGEYNYIVVRHQDFYKISG